MEIFENPSKVKEINDMFIALIPKIDRIHIMKNFRLISLSNVTYKIVTKFLVYNMKTPNRRKKIWSHSQNSIRLYQMEEEGTID
ncbi:hypothetical protein CR513_61466, partial [Mucuna pruriens]